jgi:hypothetical protein
MSAHWNGKTVVRKNMILVCCVEVRGIRVGSYERQIDKLIRKRGRELRTPRAMVVSKDVKKAAQTKTLRFRGSQFGDWCQPHD